VTANRLDQTFAALADPTRRAILARLAGGEAGVMELAKPFRMSQPAISKHLKVLERAGLIVRSRRAQSRPCRLEARPLREVADWTERYRRYASGAGGDGPPGPKMATRAAAPALCWAPWRAFRDSTRRR